MRGRHDMPAGRTETLLTPDWLFSLDDAGRADFIA
jgi:hypothetical protein